MDDELVKGSLEYAALEAFRLRGLDILLDARAFGSCLLDLASPDESTYCRAINLLFSDAMGRQIFDAARKDARQLAMARGNVAALLEECLVAPDAALRLSHSVASAACRFAFGTGLPAPASAGPSIKTTRPVSGAAPATSPILWRIRANVLYLGATEGEPLGEPNSKVPWREKSPLIYRVVIEDRISPTSTASWFCDMSLLESIEGIELLDTSRVTTMNSMFDGCKTLASLNLLGFHTQNVTTMGNMFAGCSSLKSLDLSSFDTSKVTRMFNMFDGCANLVSLDVSSFDTHNVERMTSMFRGCSSLRALDVRSFDTAKVTIMNSLFKDCSSLTSLDLRSFDTSAATDMGWMFGGLKVRELNLKHFNTAKAELMFNMFDGCTELTSLDVSSFNTSNVTRMTGMFRGCTSLQTLDLRSFDTSAVTGMGSMFARCTSLTSLDLSSFTTPNVNEMSYMFSRCTKLATVNVDHFDTSNAAAGMKSMFANCPAPKPTWYKD